MSIMKKILKAIFVMPFFAGRLKNTHSEDVFQHDGSTSAIVLLVSFIVIIFETLLIGSSNAAKKIIKSDIAVFVQIVTSCGATMCYIFISIYSFLKPNVLYPNRNWNICNKIRLRFFWLFTLSNIVYSVIFLTFEIMCSEQSNKGDYANELKIVFHSLGIIFVFVQSAFLTRFCQYAFQSSPAIYFAFLVVLMANVAVIALRFSRAYEEAFKFATNESDVIIANQTINCISNLTTNNILQNAVTFLDPTILEYSLVSMLFISDVWPSQSSHDFRSEYANINDIRNDMLNVTAIDANNGNEAGRKTRKYIVVVLCIILNIPLLLLYILRVKGSYSVDSALFIYCCFIITVIMLLFIRCFYSMQTECKPCDGVQVFTSQDYVLVATLLATMAYYTMRLIPYVFLLQTNRVNIAKTYSSVFLILSIYFEAVFLLQMGHYEKRKSSESKWITLDYVCLYLAVQNLILWINDTFISSQYIITTDASYTFYGQDTWVQFFTFLFPFVVFYHFNCFVSFFGLYHRLK